ncbi:hypothetical protein VTK26DRAFT_5323 [Humicola hyalothermophila]
MASSWFRVKDRGLLKKALTRSLMAGTRLPPPTTSTISMSSFVTLASASACSRVALMRLSSGSHMASNSSREIMARTSMSFMSDSMLMGACELADSTFLSFSAAAWTRARALGLLKISSLYFPRNSLCRCSTRALSKLRPPKWRSKAVPLTASSPFLNSTMEQL